MGESYLRRVADLLSDLELLLERSERGGVISFQEVGVSKQKQGL